MNGQPAAEPVPQTTVHEGGWCEFALNRPQCRKAITIELAEELAAALPRAQADPEVRVVLLRGSGGASCSGLDLDEIRPGERKIARAVEGVHEALRALDKPLVGALERFAINAGAAIAFACALLVVGAGAYVEVAEARMGMDAPNNVKWLLAKLDVQRALQITLGCQRIGAERLLTLGIAFEVTPDHLVVAKCRELGQTLAGYPEHVLERMKRAIP